MANEIALRPSYWASVSGGKDSLYMLNVILHNLDKYPLDGVVHYELEIDYPFIKNVIDYMESECKKIGIPFLRFKPEKSWKELYEKYGFPSRVARWCNNRYKLSAEKKLKEFLRSKGFYAVHYIGYCADEEKRYSKRNKGITEVYPLVEEGIEETSILEWAKNQPIFNNYYKTNKRCGCMLCPMASMMNLAYLCKYYPEQFNFYIDCVRQTEKEIELKNGKPFAVRGNQKYNADYVNRTVREKWLPKLEEMERINNGL